MNQITDVTEPLNKLSAKSDYYRFVFICLSAVLFLGGMNWFLAQRHFDDDANVRLDLKDAKSEIKDLKAELSRKAEREDIKADRANVEMDSLRKVNYRLINKVEIQNQTK